MEFQNICNEMAAPFFAPPCISGLHVSGVNAAGFIITYEAEKAGAVSTRATTAEETEQSNWTTDEDKYWRQMVENG